MSDGYTYLNGSIVPAGEASVSVRDRGFLYGDGLLETMRWRGGRCTQFKRHMDRLQSGMRILRFCSPISPTEVTEIIERTLEANGLSDARVRLTVTRGVGDGPGRLIPAEDARPTIIVTAQPLPGPSWEPVQVIVSAIRRDEASPLCRVKTPSYLPGILARMEARDAGCTDAIMLNTRGDVAEAVTANVFVVSGGRLITPSLDEGPLPGTTRAAVLELASRLGLQAVEGVVTLDDLAKADEVFLTSAIQLVTPVGEVRGVRTFDAHPVSYTVLESLLSIS